MRKPTNGNKGNVIRTYRIVLLNKKMDLLMSLGFNFKKLADADRNSDDDLIVALEIAYFTDSSEKWNLRWPA